MPSGAVQNYKQLVKDIATAGGKANADADSNKLVSLKSVAVTLRTSQLEILGVKRVIKKKDHAEVTDDLLLWEVSFALIRVLVSVSLEGKRGPCERY